MTSRISISLIVLSLIAWGILLYFAPDHVYWRDSGEFILGACFLDIIHPAGFPLFSQVANAFVHIPLGPLTWRVYLFVCFLGALTLLVLAVLLSKILKRNMTPFIGALAMLCTPVFIAAALSAEAYLLNGLFALVVLSLLFSWRESRDLRYLIISAFVSGLAIANHVSFGLIIVCLIPAAVMMRVPWRKVFVPALLFGALGLMVYGFLPARAMQSPPLNTGGVTDSNRFIRQVTDARDLALRVTVDESKVLIGSPTNRFSQTLRDISKSLSELPILIGVSALIGLYQLIRKDAALGMATIGISLGNLLFFSGWDPDPWIACFLIFALWSAYGLDWIVKLLKIPESVAVLIIAIVLLSTALPSSLRRASELQSFAIPEKIARNLLDKTGPGGILITEPSWFIVRTLSALEGYRPDVIPVYVPSLLFPKYFAHTKLTRADGSMYNSGLIEGEEDFVGEASEIRNLGRLVNFLGPKIPIMLEPATNLVEPLKAVLSLDDDGGVRLRSGKSGISEGFLNARESLASQTSKSMLSMNLQVQGDTMNYLESVLAYDATLLLSLDRKNEAASLLYSLCSSTSPSLCSARTLYNTATMLQAANRSCQATQIARELLKRGRIAPQNALLNSNEACG